MSLKPILKYEEEKRKKANFWASDHGKLGIDLHLALKGVEPTNKPVWSDTLKWEAGKGVELGMLNILKANGIVDPDYNQDEYGRVERDVDGLKITGKCDARIIKGGATMQFNDSVMPESVTLELNEGEPIEVKSINNKNSFDIQSYIDNKPRESYVGQLAVYLDILGLERGHLFVASIDGLAYFWFPCEKIGDGIYKAGDTVVNVKEEYKRWKSILENLDNEPNWTEELYKLPIEEVKWNELTVSKIGSARNNKAVIGSENGWKIQYSPYKNLIVEKQGTQLGYTEEELAKIRIMTAGYSSKKSKTDE